MYGFQPKSARGKAVQQLADGGMVHSIKGMLGLRPKTREELLAADAKAQARNQEAAGRVAERSAQQPAPATPAPQAAISEYSGMNAMQRREKEQGLKNGGMVMKPRGFKAGGMIQGPGTGTSDSIETEKKPGTFIMPADSTQAIGPDVLEELAEPMEAGEEGEGMETVGAESEGAEEEGEGEAVPVRLSNGEFEFTPQQVQSLGEAVLTVLRNATHEAAEDKPKAAGFKPMQGFVDGGMIENNVTRVGNSYSGGNVGGNITVNGQEPGGSVSSASPVPSNPVPATPSATPSATPAAAPSAATAPATATATPAPSAAPMGWAERNAQRSNEVTASSIMDSPERRAAQAKLTPTPAPVAPVAPTAPAIGGIQPPATAMDATKPKAVGAQTASPFGFKPRGYASGGVVKDEEKQRLANQTAMYVQGAQAAAASRPAAPPAAPTTAPAPAQPSEYGRQMREVGGALADGASWLGKTIVSAPGYGFNRLGAPAAPSTAADPAAQNPTDQRLAAGTQQAPATTPAPAPLAAPAPAATTQPPSNMIAPGIYQHGRGQYSDNASGMGLTSVPGSGGQGSPVGKTVEQAQREGLIGERVGYNPAYDQRLNGATGISAQNMAAADALAGRSQQESMNRVTARGMGSLAQSVTAPTVRNSTNDWAARKQLENMATAASSITNRPEWQSGSTTIAGSTRGPNGAGDPEGKVAAYKAALANDLALQQAQPGLAAVAMRENAGIQREGMQQEGATTRTGMTEQGSNARAAVSSALQRDEFGLKKEAAGFQTRAAAQREALRNVLLDPKATPEQRKQAQEYLQALAVSDKEPSPQYKSYVMPAIRNADGSTTEGGVYQENTRTGEGRWVKPQGDGQAQQAMPKPASKAEFDALPKGTRFTDPNGQVRIK